MNMPMPSLGSSHQLMEVMEKHGLVPTRLAIETYMAINRTGTFLSSFAHGKLDIVSRQD